MTKINFFKLFFAFMITTVIYNNANAGCPSTVVANNGGTSTARAPSTFWNNMRTHYLITAAELAAQGIISGNQFTTIGWTYNTASGTSGTGNLAIYMENTADATNIKSATWATAVGTMTTVHNAATTLQGTAGTFLVPLSSGGSFTYTGGNLYIAFDWQYTGVLAAFSPTVSCNSTVVGGAAGLKGAQNITPGVPPVTLAASAFRPQTILATSSFTFTNEVAVTNVYGLGNMAVGYATNYQIRVRLANNGSANQTSMNVTLNITGANTFTDVQTVNLNSCNSTVVTFSGFSPTAVGANTVTVSVPNDDNNANNSQSYSMNTSKDITSFRYVAPVTGGVGFTGGTGDFVAKFNAANNFGDTDTINGFEVIFTSNSQPYNVVVYDDNGIGGLPGTLLHVSASQSTIQDTVFISLPDIEVSGGYYVGIRQTGTINVGFGYQTESPVRTGEFYYGAIGAPTTDFNAGGANFRLTATVQYKTPVPPNCAIYLSPSNSGSACQNGATLSYGSGGGGPTGYKVYFGANQALVEAEDPGTLVQNSAATTYATGSLISGTAYYWRVVAYNAQGDATGCATLSRSFTATLAPCYCAGSSASAAFEHITNVQSGAFSNPTAGSLYSNYYNLGAINNVNIGSTFNITVTQPITEVYDEDRIYVYGDFNQDGDWNDVGELCGNADVTIANGNVTVVTCTVPVGATPGNTAFRIKLGDEVSAVAMNNDPCQTGFAFGEVEDYLVNVTCGALATATNPACEGASLSVNATYLGSGTPTNYSWTTTAANGFTASTANPTVAASASAANDDGVYTVVITDNNGCTSTADVTVAVNPAPQPQIGGGSPTEEVCEGLPLAFSSNNLAGGQTSTYSWSSTAANGFTSSQQNVSVTASASPAQDNGTYTVVITNQFLCTASASVAATVNPNPTLVVQSTSPVGCSTLPICDGSMVVVASGGTTPYQQYDDGTNFNLDGNFNGVMCFGAGTASVTDDKGCVGTVPFNIGAISTGPPSASVVVPPIVNLPAFACNGTLVNNINVPSVSGATKYNWDGPAGTDFNGAGNTYTNTTPNANITFGALAGGASGYYIGIQAANACGTSVRKVQWVRGTLSVPTTSGPTVVCAGGSAIYSITNAPITGAISFTWTGPAGTTFDGNPTPYTSASTSVTAVLPIGFTSGSICVTANAACISSAQKCISVSTAPSALGPMSGVFSVCPPASQTYTVSNPGVVGGTYNWTLPANASGTSTSDNINVSFASGFTGGNISVTYTNVCGVTSAARTKSISIGTPSVPASITTTTTNGLCGQAASFSCPPQAGATFNWTFPAGSTPGSITGGSNSVGSTMPGAPFSTGQVCVTATNGCGTSGPRCITVKGAPLTPGLISSVPGTWCAPASGIQFSADLSSLTGVYSLSWSVTPAGTATYVSGQATNTYTVDWDNAGPASVILTASNACGNASRSLSLNVAACSRISASNIVTTVDSKFTVYPNPAQSILNFEFNSLVSENLEVSMMDLSGRVVISETISTTEGLNTGKLDVSHLAKGVYTFKANSSNTTSVVRIVVE